MSTQSSGKTNFSSSHSSSHKTNFSLSYLGAPQITCGDTPVTAFISNKVPALLAYLAVTRRPHTRDKLAALLWGEMPDADARNNLRQALTNLRKFTGDYLTITRETIEFTGDCFLDCAEFESAVRAASSLDPEPEPASASVILTDALRLYRGDFLEGFYLRDAPEFEDWMLAERARLRELALQALHRLAEIQMNRADYPAALEATSRLLAFDPWREEAHRLRMLALARSGQRSSALAQYQTCRSILRQEFDADPSRETTTLYERIQAAASRPRHNLPAAVTGFVGRTAELAEVRRLLASPNTRILSILGPGGVGKTRLALEVAAACESMFLDGVWFASLGGDIPPTRDHLVMTLAEAAGCPLSGVEPPAKQLANALRPKELLLVVDNLDDWLEPASWLPELLVQAPEVKLLATSRQRLNLQAEQAYFLDGLAVNEMSGDELAPASQLFVTRARRLQPDFAPTEADLTAITRICRMTDGLPLGIELAAAWAHQIPCPEIAGQIESSLDFLHSAFRDTPPRHTSLREVFNWSWNRLTPAEQSAFQRLAVFSGPFSRQAALQVSGTNSEVLAALVDKSFLWRRGDMFQLHEVARQFGLEKLAAAGMEESARNRQAEYYARWLSSQVETLKSAEQAMALAGIEAEFENLRQAWDWMVARQDYAGVAATIDGLYHFLAIRSRFFQALDIFGSARQTLQPQGGDSRLERLTVCRLQAREGRFLSYLSRFDEAATLLRDCLPLLRELNEAEEIAFVLGHLGGTARTLGDLTQATQWLTECLELRRQAGDLPGQAVALLELAGVAFMSADYEAARQHCLAGVWVAEECGDQQTLAHLFTGLSLCCRELGDLEAALTYGKRAASVYAVLKDRYGLIQVQLTSGELNRQLGNYEAARQDCQQAIQLSAEIGHRSGEADGHYRLGQIEADCGDWVAAHQHQWTAVELAGECRELPLLFDALYEISCLLWGNGKQSDALLIQSWLQTQPETSGQTLGRIADALSKISPDVFAIALQSAREMSREKILGLASI